MKKKGNLTLLLYFIMCTLGFILMITFSGCITQKDVIKQYQRGGVKPTGKGELKRKQIRIDRTN